MFSFVRKQNYYLQGLTQVLSLGWEDSLEKEVATNSSILAWKIPWTEVPRGLWSMGLQELDAVQQVNPHSSLKTF